MRAKPAAFSALVAVVAVGLVIPNRFMAYDGGHIVAAQATARGLAASAARAGAQEVDLPSFWLGASGSSRFR